MNPELQFHYTTFIAKPAAEVWNALTQKEIIAQYYLAPLHTLDLQPGGRISYGTTEEIITGHITEVELQKTLAHTFNFAGSEDPETQVTYQIEPVGDDMCSLTISHTGFAEDNQTLADISGGWPVIASSLKTLLETGRKLPWPGQSQ